MQAENEEIFVGRSALQPPYQSRIYVGRTKRTSSYTSSSVKRRLQRN